jgi:hypothetical protein
VIFSTLKLVFNGASAPSWACFGHWQLGGRTLGAWAVVGFARLKDLAPYALIELLLPGGSLVALTLWFYRRRRKVPALAASLNALL